MERPHVSLILNVQIEVESMSVSVIGSIKGSEHFIIIITVIGIVGSSHHPCDGEISRLAEILSFIVVIACIHLVCQEIPNGG